MRIDFGVLENVTYQNVALLFWATLYTSANFIGGVRS